MFHKKIVDVLLIPEVGIDQMVSLDDIFRRVILEFEFPAPKNLEQFVFHEKSVFGAS